MGSCKRDFSSESKERLTRLIWYPLPKIYPRVKQMLSHKGYCHWLRTAIEVFCLWNCCALASIFCVFLPTSIMDTCAADVLRRIFSYACRTPRSFVNVALVCRRWNQIAWTTDAYLCVEQRSNGWHQLTSRFPRIVGLQILSQYRGEEPIPLPECPHLCDLDLQDGSSFPLSSFTSLRRLHLPRRVSGLPRDFATLQLPLLEELWLNSGSEALGDRAPQETPLILSTSLTGLSVVLYSGPPSHLYRLSQLTNLCWLNLSQARRISHTDLAIITRSLGKKLQSLNITSTSTLKLSWLLSLPQLRSLDLSKLSITNNDLRVLKSLVHLKALSLHQCSAITDEGVAQLTSLKKLQHLDVRATLSTKALERLFPRTMIVFQ